MFVSLAKVISTWVVGELVNVTGFVSLRKRSQTYFLNKSTNRKNLKALSFCSNANTQFSSKQTINS